VVKEKVQMNIRRIVPSCLFVLLLAGVVWAGVNVDWDKSASFTGFKTYAWGKGTPAKNQLMDQRIVDGVDKQLAAKGLQKVAEDANPDLVVVYHAAVGHQEQINTMGTGGWGWRWGGGMSTTTVDKIPTGHLVVDIGDAKTKKLLWMGTATDTLSDKPEKNEKKIESALNNMFKKYPPPVKK